MTAASSHHRRPGPRGRAGSLERPSAEVMADARPIPDDWGFDDLTDEEREAFLAAVADA